MNKFIQIEFFFWNHPRYNRYCLSIKNLKQTKAINPNEKKNHDDHDEKHYRIEKSQFFRLHIDQKLQN